MLPEPQDAPPEVPSTAPCARCGTFVVAGQEHPVLGKILCAACTARPEITQMVAFRQRHWGRRTMAVWMLGLVALLSGFIAYEEVGRALTMGAGRAWAGIGLDVVVTVGASGYFLRQRWARPALFLVPFVPAVGLAEFQGPVGEAVLYVAAFAAASGLWFVHRSVRQRLFFRMEVEAGALERAWRRSAPNRIARLAARLALGLTAVLVGFLIISDPLIEWTEGDAEPYVWGTVGVLLLAILASAFLGLVGLARYRPSANPPVGGVASSTTALLVGVGWIFLVGFSTYA